MSHRLRFHIAHNYDTRKIGIELPVLLRAGEIEKRFEAKIDTGASHCIFERQQGERLGLKVESGIPETFGTAARAFLATGMKSRWLSSDWKQLRPSISPPMNISRAMS